MNPQFGMGMNMGFGMQGMPNMGMPNMGMPNMGMPNMANMNMGNMNMGNFMQNQGEEEEWMKGFKMGVEEVNNTGEQDGDANTPGPKMNVIFKTTQGTAHTMVYNYGTTIDQALAKYLNRVGRPDLIGDKSNKICFLFNAAQLKFKDQTKVEAFFKNVNNPKVVVNDVNNLIGA